MKTKQIVIVLTLCFLASAKALAQDAVFTQWENMPLYLNPALTGNFDGQLRLRAQHRNQWRSLLGDNSYKTSAVSAEYKFSNAGSRKISVGSFFIKDKAGSLDFRNGSINLSTSVVQNLGNPDKAHHSIAIGFNGGLTTSTIDYGNAQWPGGVPPTDINGRTSYADVSAGLLWQYKSSTHFSFNLGSALYHLNRPNVAFSDSSVSRLYHRFNLHGHVEIPLVQKFSIIPSFLFSNQGPSEQLLYGFNSRWYLNPQDQNFLQLGFFVRSTNSFYGKAISSYMLSATVQINSVLLGFLFDRYQDIDSNAYEFSVGYILGLRRSKDPEGF